MNLMMIYLINGSLILLNTALAWNNYTNKDYLSFGLNTAVVGFVVGMLVCLTIDIQMRRGW